ncbi:MAG TPA: 1-phosphofructokinase family hexose kinase, partial [Actinopolymorphaceae bacterium]|nr:1-phosphofructokinase family hexose kinase [Actinopolymorphaceae bacterium]
CRSGSTQPEFDEPPTTRRRVTRHNRHVILTVTPNPSVDRTVDLASLVPGEVNRASAHHVEPSGKGVNVARALRINGVRATAVIPVGGPEGAQLVALLDDEGVSHLDVPIAGAVRVNISVRTPDGQVTKFNEPGPVLSWAEAEALAETVLTRMGRADWVVGSGSLPGGMAAGFYAELGEKVRRDGGRFALDSSGGALRAGLEGRPDLVKPNLAELAELAGCPLTSLGAAIAAADDVRRTTGGAVLVSLGPAGALLVDGEPPLHVEVRTPVRVRSSVGAGDNLLAGYLSRVSAGGDRRVALAEAVAWATVAVRARGSLARAVTDGDRRSVHVHGAPDTARVLP